MNLQERVFIALHGTEDGGLTRTQRTLLATIVVAVALAIIGTEPELPAEVSAGIEWAEQGLGVAFLLEYVARVWSAGTKLEFRGISGRLDYMRRPIVVFDAIALIPFLVGATGAESFVLRAIRVLRLLALAKLARYSEAMRIVLRSVIDRRFEFLFAIVIAGLMILVSSSALYVVEGASQPNAFGSILRSMWWSVATLTTVGYGDVVPLSPLGKFFAGLTALAGIGMIAMPTGILAASLSEGFAKAREGRRRGGRRIGD